MGRHRKSDNKLPPYVYPDHGRYQYRPYEGQGKLAKPVRLCGIDAPLSEVWAAWEAQQGKPTYNFATLARRYLKSDKFKSRSPRTQHDYHGCYERVCRAELTDDRRFGDLALDEITPGMIRKYLDMRAEQGAPVTGNREKAFISLVFSWGYERDLAPPNPCLRVSRNAEVARSTYVSDAEYQYIYDLARTHAPAYIRPSTELAYLCRMRKVEVLALSIADIKAEGVLVRRTKGSRDGLTRWSPRLRQVIDDAKAASRIAGLTVIRGRDGQPINESTFDTAWQRLQVLAVKRGGTRIWFHDLKAKGINDFEEDKKKAGGHRSEQMVERYNRKLMELDATR